MHVAITGAAGFLGGALRARMTDARASDIDTLDVRHSVPPEVFEGCEVVVHLAALTGVGPSLTRADDYRRTNHDGTANVMTAAVAAGVRRLVLVSSSSVYGECPVPAGEGRALAPLSPYGTSKVNAESVLRDGPGSLERVILRPFTVYGPGQRSDMLLARMLAGEAVRLFPFVRDFTYVDEVADAVLAACSVAVEPDAVFVANLGSGRPVGAEAMVDAFEEVTGGRPTVSWVEQRPGEPVQTWADPSVARAELCMPEPLSLVEGLRRQAEAPASEK